MDNRKIIFGPPGCGKTTFLLNEVDKELAAGVRPDQIGYFSFTRKATQEAVTRACKKFSMKREDFPYFRTLHSLAFQQLGLSRERVMSARNYRSIGEALGLQFSEYMDFEEGIPVSAKTGDQCIWLTGLSRAMLKPLQEIWNTVPNGVDWFQLKQFSDTLAKYKEETGLIDFSDMLDLCGDTSAPLPIKVAVIDEAQDLSRQQWNLILYLVMNAERVYIAGDDDQAIYRWSGAMPEELISLEGHRIVLDQSYRLPKKIHNFCSAISKRIKNRVPKDWKPREEDGEVNFIASLDHIVWKPGTYFILARNQYLLSSIEEAIRRAGIPYTTARKSSVDQDHIQAIILWEKLRRGESISGSDARLVYKFLKSGTGVARGFKLLKKVDDATMVDLAFLKEDGGLLVDSIWHEALDGIPVEDREFYVAAKRRGEKLGVRPRVHISTIHGVKGGEADHVILLSDMAARTYNEYQVNPDDEHRVAFVGASRAKKTLSIVMPQTYRFYDYR